MSLTFPLGQNIHGYCVLQMLLLMAQIMTTAFMCIECIEWHCAMIVGTYFYQQLLLQLVLCTAGGLLIYKPVGVILTMQSNSSLANAL